MTQQFDPSVANEEYKRLLHYTEVRTAEISRMMQPYTQITDAYGCLISRIVLLLGTQKPKDVQDVVIRDLTADVFDFLYESRAPILAGKLQVAFVIARRAYESLSLLHLCCLDKSEAEKWHKEKRIENSEIRKKLDLQPLGESKQNLKDLYDFFCLATHPNRVLIPQRYLGEGNEYVLGVSGQPDLVLVTDYCFKVLGMWFWFGATASYFYRDLIAEHDKGFLEEYHRAAAEARRTNKWLAENFNSLLKESQEYWSQHPPTS
jgi:hypothetical protein